MKTNFYKVIYWVEKTTLYNKELIKENSISLSTRELIYLKDNIEKLTVIKEYLKDYEQLAKDYEQLAEDYQELSRKNSLLRLQKMELESNTIFEDMKMVYRANRRKWKSKP